MSNAKIQSAFNPLCFLLVSVACAFAEQPTAATTEDGRKVLIYPDGTWQLDKSVGGQAALPGTPSPTATTAEATQNKTDATWTYSESEDKIGRGVTRSASVQSLNALNFAFPYSGNQHALLTLRIRPKDVGRPPDHNKDVVLQIEQGQFLIRHGSNDRVKVRFDTGKPQGLFFNGAADQSRTTIFLSDYAHFLNEIRNAKRFPSKRHSTRRELASSTSTFLD